ncbi:MAG: hypothetical protein V1773_10130 [bacterium]
MKQIIPVFVLFLICFGFSNSFAQDVTVTNVNYTVKPDVIEITYDLSGDYNKEYEIIALLKRETRPDFKFELKTVTGDISEGKYVGTNRKIIWNYKKDFSIDPNVDDYYFEINAEKVSGGISWYYYVGAVVGGAVAVVLTVLKPETTTENPPATQNVTLPPTRP